MRWTKIAYPQLNASPRLNPWMAGLAFGPAYHVAGPLVLAGQKLPPNVIEAEFGTGLYA